ncbi:DUF6048 family protein [Sediminitomix flava]|uniref:Outer membrane beta-barrel porin/alpha-amylase n=1 Tax=Sediminitomix flava TaxID=379075 RepID=A0A315Z7V0_SEDFL|nr:DUF6048 family protein [Sediminitomix flava]PWJ39116.1 hypothetical protein BC781_10617 [Sediminitomix flava]
MQFNKYSLILFLVFSHFVVNAQEVIEWDKGKPQTLTDNEHVDIKVEWPKVPILGVRLGTEVVGPATSVLKSGFTSFEIAGELLFRNRFFLSLEYGNTDVTRDDLDTEQTIFPGDIQNPSKATYTSNGNYFRIGLDYNFLHRSSINDAVTLGFRYAQSSFDQSATVFSEGNDFWGQPPGFRTFEDKNLSVKWFEAVVGYKIMVVNNLYIGASLRFAVLLDEPQNPNVTPNDIPGIGYYNGDDSKINLNGYIAYRIPIGKPKVTYTEKK